MKSLFATFAFVAALLLFTGEVAQAGDYTVIYAIDAHGKIETGRIDSCEFEKLCLLESKSQRIRINFDFSPSKEDYEIKIGGIDRECCFFDGGERSVRLATDRKKARYHLNIFEGRARRGVEVVRNIPIGFLDVGLIRKP